MTAAVKKKKPTDWKYQMIARNVRGAMNFVFRPLGDLRRNTLLSTLSEQLVPEVAVDVGGGRRIKFWCLGGWSAYRAHSILKKEPHTIRWIDGFEEGTVFWDVGANIGVFSLYAAVTKKARTWSFEPSASNGDVLQRNIEINGLDGLITGLPIAFSDKTGLDRISMKTTRAGNTGGQFSSGAAGVFHQGCLGFTIDDFIAAYKVPVPNYLKIDVDGLEPQIVRGAEKTLANPALRGVLLEFETDDPFLPEVQATMARHGFALESDHPTVPGRETTRNYIYTRQAQA